MSNDSSFLRAPTTGRKFAKAIVVRILSAFSLLVVSFVARAQAETPASADVADAARQLTGQRAHMSQDIRLLAGKAVTGPALTLRLVRDRNASDMAAGLALIKVFEEAPAGSIVVASLNDDRDYAVFGSTLARLAAAKKLGGFVVDGAVRDVSDLQQLALPTLARGTVAGSAGSAYRIDAVNVVIECGGIKVKPGDQIVADHDGVAVVPKERLAEVMAKARDIRAEEQFLLQVIAERGSLNSLLQKSDSQQRSK